MPCECLYIVKCISYNLHSNKRSFSNENEVYIWTVWLDFCFVSLSLTPVVTSLIYSMYKMALADTD